MISAFYQGEEFFRCSFYVYNNYKEDVEQITEHNFDINKVYRKFLTEQPRILIKDIEWEDL